MTIPGPTKEQAETLAQLLEAGVPAADAVDIAAPALRDEERQACAERWPDVQAVRDARIRLNDGKTWLAMTQAERIAYTLRVAYNAMAYAVWASPPGVSGEKARLDRVLGFVDRLEKRAAGAAQPGGDGWTAFLEGIAKDQKLAQALAVGKKPASPARHEAERDGVVQ